jgi:hypothetical protein
MRQFKEIFAQAAQRKGGAAALEQILAETPSRTPAEIATIPDHRILAEMTDAFSTPASRGRWSTTNGRHSSKAFSTSTQMPAPS